MKKCGCFVLNLGSIFLLFLTVLKYVTQGLWPSVFPKHKLYVWSTCMYKESGFGPFKLDSLTRNVHVLGLPAWKTIAVLQEPEEPWNATKSVFICGAFRHWRDEHFKSLGMLDFNHSLSKVFLLLMKFVLFWCFFCYPPKSSAYLSPVKFGFGFFPPLEL